MVLQLDAAVSGFLFKSTSYLKAISTKSINDSFTCAVIFSWNYSLIPNSNLSFFFNGVLMSPVLKQDNSLNFVSYSATDRFSCLRSMKFLYNRVLPVGGTNWS